MIVRDTETKCGEQNNKAHAPPDVDDEAGAHRGDGGARGGREQGLADGGVHAANGSQRGRLQLGVHGERLAPCVQGRVD